MYKNEKRNYSEYSKSVGPKNNEQMIDDKYLEQEKSEQDENESIGIFEQSENITQSTCRPLIKEEVVTGIVTGCFNLNVRKNPDLNSDVLCGIVAQTKVAISNEESTDEWFKVRTESGVEGFCMKDYLIIQQ